MNVIIFSKDRAAQLDLLLRSIPEDMRHYTYPYVLYTFSDRNYELGYSEILRDWDWSGGSHGFSQQYDFKNDLLELFDPHKAMTMFLTDDDVFLSDYIIPQRLPDNVTCLSLRLNPHMDYCYTLNRKQTIPRYFPIRQNDGDKIGNVWNWRLADADYGYPMSLDGHIFRTSDILPLLEKLDYHDPNSLEAALARNPINRPMMMCFDKSVIVNNPINRVQDTIKNRHGNVSAEWLNEQFLAGRRIKLEPFIGIEPNACHVELPIEWE